MNCILCGVDASNQATCHKCEDGYNFKNNECAYICKLNKCLACTANSSVCNQCMPNHQFNKTTQLCECIAQNCAECSKADQGECTTCVTGYTLNVSKACDCSVKNCQTCNKSDGSKCDQCKNNYVWSDTLKGCDSEIPFCKFMSRTKKGICDQCNDNYQLNTQGTACDCKFKACEGCIADSITKICKNCYKGYAWDTVSKTCKCTQQNCTECDIYDGNVCKTCQAGMELTADKKCSVKCEVTDCKKCSATDGKVCEECISQTNFNLVAGKCICKIEKCQKCSSLNDSICDACENGYLFDSSQKKCICSISNCKQCGNQDSTTGLTNCSTCADGYIHPDSSQLNKCVRDCSSISNCLQCTDDLSTCTQCTTNFTYNSSSNKCECQMQSCVKCSTKISGSCEECLKGYIIVNGKCQCSVSNCKNCSSTDGSICNVCQDGYQWNSTTSKCEIKIKNCQTLDSSNYEICSKCDQNYVFDSSNKQCKCKLDKCLNCETLSSGECKQCQSQYVWNSTLNNCACSDKNCLVCNDSDGTKCNQCKQGYSLDSNNTCKLTCIVENCIECESNNNAICKKCSLNLVWDGSKCNCGIQNCQKCHQTTDGFCELCNKGYIFNSAEKKCKCSDTNCQTCETSDGSICVNCSAGFIVDQQTKECIAKCDVQNCLKCQKLNGQVCQQCINDNFKVDSNGKCQCLIDKCQTCSKSEKDICDACESGFIFDQTSKKCKCSVSYCSACTFDNISSKTKCSQCEPGYNLVDDGSGLKTCEKDCSSIEKCLKCNDSATICTQCAINHEFSSTSKKCECNLEDAKNGICTKCSVTNQGSCDTCTNNYKLDNGKCKCQVENCLKCVQNDGLICSTCKPGYEWIAIEKKCKISIKDCVELDGTDPTVCKQCLKQKQKFNTSTKQCECTLEHCIDCDTNGAGSCIQCSKGYKWSSTLNQCICNDDNCQKCQNSDGTICNQCKSDYEMNTFSNGICVQICKVSNCEECQPNDGKQCKRCIQNFVVDGKECKCNIDKCQTCGKTQLNICDQCQQGYQFNSSSKQCECITPNCKLCNWDAISNQSKCTECNQGFSLDNLQCKRLCNVENCAKCPSNPNICDECVVNHSVNSSKNKCNCNIEKCLKCNVQKSGFCDQCDDGYHFDSVLMKCLCTLPNCQTCTINSSKQKVCQKCNDNFEINSAQNCKRICLIDKCMSCQDDGKCQQCEDGYSLDATQMKCFCTLPNCQTCTINSSKQKVCQKCNNDFEIDSTQNCKRICLIDKCQSCLDNGKCQQCQDGYSLDSQSMKCFCTLPNCQTCVVNSSKQKVCQKCNDDFQIDQTQNCKRICKINNCTSCSDDGKCIQCEQSYELNQSKTICTKCQVANCKECEFNNPLQCKECINNTFELLLPDNKECIIKEKKYIFDLKQQLIDEEYLIIITFENEIKENLKDQKEFHNIFSFTITNKLNYTYTYNQINKKQIELKIKMSEDCKQEKFELNIKDKRFIQINSLKKIKDECELTTYVIIPHQVKEDTKATTETTKIITNTILGTAIIASVLGGFFAFFAIIDISAYIYYLLFINIRYPYNIVEFGKLFLNFQFAYIPNIFDSLIDSSYVQPSHSKFMENKTDSFFLKNCGRSIFVILIVVSIYMLLKLLCFVPIRRMQNYLIKKTKEVWEYNAFISVAWITYIYLVVACLLQFYSFEMNGNLSYGNYNLFAAVSIILIIIPFILLKALYNCDNPKTDQLIQTKYFYLVAGLNSATTYKQQINTAHNCFSNFFRLNKRHQTRTTFSDDNYSPQSFRPKQMSRVGPTTIDENSSPSIGYLNQASSGQLNEHQLYEQELLLEKKSILVQLNKYTLAIQFIRKLIFAIFIVALHDHSFVQIGFISALNLIFGLYYFFSLPFVNLLENIKHGTTEFIFIIIHILVATLKADDKYEIEIDRIKVGWGFISLCILILAIHFISLIFRLYYQIAEFIQELKQKKLSQISPMPCQQEALEKFNKDEELSPVKGLNLKKTLQIVHGPQMSFGSQVQMIQVDNLNPESNQNQDFKTDNQAHTPTKTVFNFEIQKRGQRRPRTNLLNVNTRSGLSTMNQLDVIDTNKSHLETGRINAGSAISFDDSPVRTQNPMNK